MTINSNKTTFYTNLILKLVFAGLLAFFFYRQIVKNKNLDQTWELFLDGLQETNLIFLFFCVFLIPVNWAIESEKWRLLVLPFEKIDFLKSFKAVVSGISVAILTPNRIGEYAGRMVMVKAENNWKAVISTLVSSYAQNICNIGIGLMALSIFLYKEDQIAEYLFYASISISIILLLLMTVIYYNIDLFTRFFENWKKIAFLQKVKRHALLLRNYNTKTLSTVLFWALLRYFVYLIQYFLILRFFGLDVNLVMGCIGIATIFLVQTSLPLPPILGFLARGEIALLVWESYSFNEISVLASSYTLWLMNLIIPSLVGSIIILSSNLSRTFGLNRNYFN